MFPGFTAADFDAYQQKKWKSNAFNRERLEVKQNEEQARTALQDKRLGHVLLELLLLVAGILIALGVNGWIEDRREATSERLYLERLARDFNQDLEVLDEFVSFEERQTNDAVLAYRPLCGGAAVDDREEVARALDHLTGRRTIRFARATYSDLLSTGNLRLIRDAALRDRIVKLYESNERWAAIIDRNNQVYVDQLYLGFMMGAGLVEPRPDSNLPSVVAPRQAFARRLGTRVRSPMDRLWNLPPEQLDVLRADGDQPERPVSEHLAYLWLFPDYGAGVILATAFSDLVQAGRWRPVLDDLATTGVTLRQPGE